MPARWLAGLHGWLARLHGWVASRPAELEAAGPEGLVLWLVCSPTSRHASLPRLFAGGEEAESLHPQHVTIRTFYCLYVSGLASLSPCRRRRGGGAPAPQACPPSHPFVPTYHGLATPSHPCVPTCQRACYPGPHAVGGEEAESLDPNMPWGRGVLKPGGSLVMKLLQGTGEQGCMSRAA